MEDSNTAKRVMKRSRMNDKGKLSVQVGGAQANMIVILLSFGVQSFLLDVSLAQGLSLILNSGGWIRTTDTRVMKTPKVSC
jgi:hypothetical protein